MFHLVVAFPFLTSLDTLELRFRYSRHHRDDHICGELSPLVRLMKRVFESNSLVNFHVKGEHKFPNYFRTRRAIHRPVSAKLSTITLNVPGLLAGPLASWLAHALAASSVTRLSLANRSCSGDFLSRLRLPRLSRIELRAGPCDYSEYAYASGAPIDPKTWNCFLKRHPNIRCINLRYMFCLGWAIDGGSKSYHPDTGSCGRGWEVVSGRGEDLERFFTSFNRLGSRLKAIYLVSLISNGTPYRLVGNGLDVLGRFGERIPMNLFLTLSVNSDVFDRLAITPQNFFDSGYITSDLPRLRRVKSLFSYIYNPRTSSARYWENNLLPAFIAHVFPCLEYLRLDMVGDFGLYYDEGKQAQWVRNLAELSPTIRAVSFSTWSRYTTVEEWKRRSLTDTTSDPLV
ncbi:hypothetical protein PQX77_003652 [Marasmius sp. AFHP31]|nr:hypothetical protein PQX77_003652 [Marasmius sp. AFHP31]